MPISEIADTRPASNYNIFLAGHQDMRGEGVAAGGDAPRLLFSQSLLVLFMLVLLHSRHLLNYY